MSGAPLESIIKLGKYKNIEVSSSDKKQKEDELIQIIIANSQMEVAKGMIEQVAAKMAEEFANRLSQQGLSVEQYYSMTGLDAAQLLEQMMPVAKKRVKGRLVLEAVAKAEHLEATEEEYNRELSRLSDRYLAETDEIKKLVAGEEEYQIKTDIAIQKALFFVMDSAIEKQNE